MYSSFSWHNARNSDEQYPLVPVGWMVGRWSEQDDGSHEAGHIPPIRQNDRVRMALAKDPCTEMGRCSISSNEERSPVRMFEGARHGLTGSAQRSSLITE